MMGPILPPPPKPTRGPILPLRGPIPPPPQINEKNGLMVKIPPEEDEDDLGGTPPMLGGSQSGGAGGSPRFTGLGKEEVLRAAGTAPWRRARALLLVLFWGGWLGMVGAAAAIVARAPRCDPPGPWWQKGALYRAPPKPFGGDLKGVSDHLHPLGAQRPLLEELDPALGTLGDLEELLKKAKDRGLRVLLDLTPDPWGAQPWGGENRTRLTPQLPGAVSAWLGRGLKGIFLDAVEELEPELVAEWRNLTEKLGGVLVLGSRSQDPLGLRRALNVSGEGQLLIGQFPTGSAPIDDVIDLLRNPKIHLGWSVGSPRQHALGSLDPSSAPWRLLLLWMLPGPPVLNYGDEVGLTDPPGGDGQLTPMPWELIGQIQEGGNSSEAVLLSLSRRLSRLRSQEPVLQRGGFEPVTSESGTSAFLRSWDFRRRFLVVLNRSPEPRPPFLATPPGLPARATLLASTHGPRPPPEALELNAMQLRPHEGAVLGLAPPTP
ncbi:amino acid transporter heavy chain SLC3A2 isoform X2 [Patagioenas fasciata]|uniref:amino acid transporter heavy chain SLC3A2 isoform X2 n=1 Tax=Patagioenas fasciata TaxID=372321 RepID=UPI003A98F974